MTLSNSRFRSRTTSLLIYVEVGEADVAPLPLGPVVVPPADPIEFALVDVLFADDIRSGSREHLVVVVADVGRSVDVLQDVRRDR